MRTETLMQSGQNELSQIYSQSRERGVHSNRDTDTDKLPYSSQSQGTQSQRGGTTNKRKLSLEVLAGESSPVNRVALAPPEAAADCEELQRQNAELCAKLEEASACMAEASLRFDEEAQEQLAVRQVCARATAVCWGWCMV